MGRVARAAHAQRNLEWQRLPAQLATDVQREELNNRSLEFVVFVGFQLCGFQGDAEIAGAHIGENVAARFGG